MFNVNQYTLNGTTFFHVALGKGRNPYGNILTEAGFAKSQSIPGLGYGWTAPVSADTEEAIAECKNLKATNPEVRKLQAQIARATQKEANLRAKLEAAIA